MSHLRLAIQNMGKFLRLPVAIQALCLRALALTLFIRICLWVIPFRALRSALSKLSKPRLSPDQPAGCLAWAVQTASIGVPRATCLTQALALQVLLRRRGTDCHLRLGVGHDANGGVVAHAWLESEGRVLIGNQELSRYSPFVGLHDQTG